MGCALGEVRNVKKHRVTVSSVDKRFVVVDRRGRKPCCFVVSSESWEDPRRATQNLVYPFQQVRTSSQALLIAAHEQGFLITKIIACGFQ